jgi:starch synthase (maltosyl-transferring)
VDVPLAAVGLGAGEPYRMHELLTDVAYDWHGPRGYVELDPEREPAQIFHLRRP